MSDDGLIKLWPTSLMKRQLPGSAEPNQLLRGFIEKLDSEADNLTTRYRESDFLQTGHPAATWLLKCINKTVVDYFHAHNQRYQCEWQVQSWPNINRFGDYHDLHNHPHSYLSGTYYVSVPVEYESLPGRDDRRPGAISFYDPRPQANMNAVRADPQIEAEYTVQPVDGMLLLWPSFLHHFVHPNLSREPRISISFNIVLNRTESLLPEQG